MPKSLFQAFQKNFLGQCADWFKITILGFLLLNPFLYHQFGAFAAGWVFMAEFIFCLAMALQCYPLQSGGLLAFEAIVLGLISPEAIYHETMQNFQVILLLIFMVAGIYFMKQGLMVIFTGILVRVRSKIKLSLLFCLVAAVLSAFLDALTVTAVIIGVGVGFYSIYHRAASNTSHHHLDHDHSDDNLIREQHRHDLACFRQFLRNLLMHAVIGTALGGVCTLVGEPQNLLIAHKAGWEFMEFFYRMAPITLPVLIIGLLTCYCVERWHWFGYGGKLPDNVHQILNDFAHHAKNNRTPKERAQLWVQALVGLWLVVALTFHLAEVGLIGLSVIVLISALNGITDERAIGHAFEEALPFTALIVVFFAIVAMTHQQHLFEPVTDMALAMEGGQQVVVFYLANGLLSMISDNVFVATIYINEVLAAFNAGSMDRFQFDLIAAAINTGTNILSIATPNGQAAFLFLLTSTLAPLIRLSYLRMVWMAVPYTFTMSLTGLLSVIYLLEPATRNLIELGFIAGHESVKAL